MCQFGLDDRPVRSSSLASRPAQQSGLHRSVACTGWRPARRAALLKNERNGPANEGPARGVWLHIRKAKIDMIFVGLHFISVVCRSEQITKYLNNLILKH